MFVTVNQSERYVMMQKAQFIRVIKHVKGITRFCAGWVILIHKTSTCKVEILGSNTALYPSLKKLADMVHSGYLRLQDIVQYRI